MTNIRLNMPFLIPFEASSNSSLKSNTNSIYVEMQTYIAGLFEAKFSDSLVTKRYKLNQIKQNPLFPNPNYVTNI